MITTLLEIFGIWVVLFVIGMLWLWLSDNKFNNRLIKPEFREDKEW